MWGQAVRSTLKGANKNTKKAEKLCCPAGSDAVADYEILCYEVGPRSRVLDFCPQCLKVRSITVTVFHLESCRWSIAFLLTYFFSDKQVVPGQAGGGNFRIEMLIAYGAEQSLCLQGAGKAFCASQHARELSFPCHHLLSWGSFRSLIRPQVLSFHVISFYLSSFHPISSRAVSSQRSSPHLIPSQPISCFLCYSQLISVFLVSSLLIRFF